MRDPKRAKLRKDNAAPKCTQSRMESELPKRVIPYTAITDPIRAKLRKDNAAPTVT